MDIEIKNATIVTMDSGRRILKNQSIGIADGRIIGIEEKIKEESEYVIDGKGKLVMPGLINAHTHLPMTLLRGVADDIPLMTWLQDHIWPIEANLTKDHIKAGADLGILEMIKSGTTCFNDMYWHMETVGESVEKSGFRAALSTPLLDVMGPDQRGRLLREGESMIKKFQNHPRITPFLGPHAPYTCSEELLSRVMDLQEKYRIGVHIHVSETKGEVDNLKNEKGRIPFEYLEGLGFLNDRVVAAHSVWVSEKEMDIMKKRGVNVAHNPVSNMKIAAGIAPVLEFLKMGIDVGLGTDGAASNNNLDMFEDLKITALLHKVSSHDPSAMPAQTALEMVTIGGARVLSLDNEIGSIEVGKKADMIMVDLNKPNLTPLTHPISHLVYSTRGSDVSDSIIDGKIVMEDYRVKSLDDGKIMRIARTQAEDLLEKSGTVDRLF
jgi:5-methylthioadenosine/S-adenosylhomocysteine deaminase